MKRTFVLMVGVLLALPALAKVEVVATTADLAAVAREIGRDKVSITTLAKPTEDPHFIDPKPSYIVKLNRADLLLEGGAELEIGWLSPLLEQSRNPKLATGAPGRFSASGGVELLEVGAAADRSKGDIHAAGNPHYLIDPVNCKTVAGKLRDRLSAIDPKSAAAYQQNYADFAGRLDRKLGEWESALKPFGGSRIVAYHNSWPYFAKRFNLRIDLFLEPKPGLPPTPGHLAEVITVMQAEKVKVIFVEPHLNRKTAETVARNSGAGIVEVSHFPGGIKGSEGGYLELLDTMVRSLVAALKGN